MKTISCSRPLLRLQHPLSQHHWRWHRHAAAFEPETNPKKIYGSREGHEESSTSICSFAWPTYLHLLCVWSCSTFHRWHGFLKMWMCFTVESLRAQDKNTTEQKKCFLSYQISVQTCFLPKGASELNRRTLYFLHLPYCPQHGYSLRCYILDRQLPHPTTPSFTIHHPAFPQSPTTSARPARDTATSGLPGLKGWVDRSRSRGRSRGRWLQLGAGPVPSSHQIRGSLGLVFLCQLCQLSQPQLRIFAGI